MKAKKGDNLSKTQIFQNKSHCQQRKINGSKRKNLCTREKLLRKKNLSKRVWLGNIRRIFVDMLRKKFFANSQVQTIKPELRNYVSKIESTMKQLKDYTLERSRE